MTTWQTSTASLKSLDTRRIKICAELEPVPFKRVMTSGKRRFNDSRYTNFKNQLGYIAKGVMRGQAPLAGAIKISVDVYRNLKPESLKFGDADNHLKAVMDALNGICYEDDRQIIDATVRLHKGEPHIEIELEELK